MAWRLAPNHLIGAAAVATLAVLAASVGSELPGASRWSVGVDVAVGITFVIAGVLAPGPVRMRVSVAGVGVTWLLATVVPEARLAHQGLLAIGLVSFPGGWPVGVVRLFLAAAAVPVGLGMVPQLGTAALFAGIAATALATATTRTSVAAWYPAGAALGMCLVLAGWWTWSRVDPGAFDPSFGLLVYQVLLIVTAIAFPFAAAGVIARRGRMTDLVLGETPTGLDGLAAVLTGMLGDPGIRIHRWPLPDPGASEATDKRRIEVSDGTAPIAVVEYKSAVLEDPSTAEAVAAAVRLAVRHLQLEEDLQAQLVDLEAARARLVATTDRQRETTATRLREDVVTLLREATAALDRTMAMLGDEPAADALAIAVGELTAAEDEVLGLVAGVPPVELGGGRLHDAVAALAEHSPVPATVTTAPDATGDADQETTLFYVCSEAVTNAVKHAGASRIDITVSRDGDAIVLAVSDDGRGGADISGSGLQGLADRLATHRGRLRVDSPPGTGTMVTATLPVSRSSARA